MRLASHSARRAVLPATIALALGILASPAAAVTPTPLLSNLLKNPSAETGAAADGTQVLAIPGWKKTSNFTVVAYGTPGYPTETFGDQMFACGPNTAKATLSQVVPIAATIEQIDKGHMMVEFDMRIAANGADKGWATVAFLDAKGKRISNRTSITSNNTGNLYAGVGLGQLLPKNTRAVRVTLTGKRASGSYCDVFFDYLDLSIHSYPS